MGLDADLSLIGWGLERVFTSWHLWLRGGFATAALMTDHCPNNQITLCWRSSLKHMLAILFDLSWKQQRKFPKSLIKMSEKRRPKRLHSDPCMFCRSFILSLPFLSPCLSRCVNKERECFHRSDGAKAAPTWSSTRRSGHTWEVGRSACHKRSGICPPVCCRLHLYCLIVL